MKNTRSVSFLSAPRLSQLLLLSVIAVIGQQGTAEPLLFHARYEAKAYGFSAQAERYLIKQEDGSYLLRNKIGAELLGATVAEVDERSSFQWHDEQLTPLSYSFIQSGVSSAREQIHFDWTSNKATSVEDDESWVLDLQDGVIDKLAYQLRLREMLKRAVDSELTFQVLNKDEIETYHFKVVGEEILNTKMGRLNTLKIERNRALPDRRGTIIWLATDWDYLLVGLEQTDRRGRKVELKLNSATLNGEVVQPLP